MNNFILKLIDPPYVLFKKFIPLKTYRYAVCGGSNLVLDTVLYFIVFQFLVSKQNIDLGMVVLSPHIASLFFVFPITFSVGFLLNRYIVFSESILPVKVQFFRYLLVGLLALFISYASMKLLVDVLLFYPTPSRLVTIVITVLVSYVLQNKFSFKIK